MLISELSTHGTVNNDGNRHDMHLPSRSRSFKGRHDEPRKDIVSHSKQRSTLNALDTTNMHNPISEHPVPSSKVQRSDCSRRAGSGDDLRARYTVPDYASRRSLLPQPRSTTLSTLARETRHVATDRVSTIPSEVSKSSQVLGTPAPSKALHSALGRREEPGEDPQPVPSLTPAANQDVDITLFKMPAQTIASLPVNTVKRSQSLRKPTTYGPTPRVETRGHSRNVSAISQASESKLRAPHHRQMSHVPTSMGPPPRPSTGSTPGTRPASAASDRGSISGASRRSSSRPTSGKGRVSDAIGRKGASSTASKHTKAPAPTSQVRGNTRIQPPVVGLLPSKSTGNASRKPTRPAFSTLQQSSTPKNASKPSTPYSIAPSLTKKLSLSLMSPDIVRLQTELLQLHLLHRDSAKVQRQWERSAENKLRDQHEKLVARHKEIRLTEAKVQERIDLQAFEDWRDKNYDLAFEERIQLLSRTLQDLCSHNSPGGKFIRTVTAFEQWLVSTEDRKPKIERDDASAAHDLHFVESIGDGWKAEVAALERNLTSHSLSLKRVGPALEGSTLAAVIGCCTAMITQMVDELRVIREIESEMLENAEAWLRAKVDQIDHGDHDETSAPGSVPRRPVWKSG